MIIYPMSQTEQKIVHWGGRAITFFAIGMTLLLGAVSFLAT